MLTAQLAGNADIEKLQEALKKWATAKGGTIPPAVTGQLDAITLYSAIQIFPQVADKVPGGKGLKPIFDLAKWAVDKAGGLGAGVAVVAAVRAQFPSEWASFEQTIASNAGYIAQGINIALALSGGGNVPNSPGAPTAVVGTNLKLKLPVAKIVGQRKYPAGSLHYFNARKRIFVVAVPTLDGFNSPLGQSYARIESVTDPGQEGSTLSTESVVEGKFPFYKKKWFWGALAGAAVVVGGVTFVLVRR